MDGKGDKSGQGIDVGRGEGDVGRMRGDGAEGVAL